MTPKPSERPLWFLPLLGFLIPVGIGSFFLYFQSLKWSAENKNSVEIMEEKSTKNNERFAELSTECQSVRSIGAIPIEKESDVTGSDHYLLDGPSNDANKKINYTLTKAVGNTEYLIIDYSTRVFVECMLPSTNYAYVRITEPEFLAAHRGWVPASVLTKDLFANSIKSTSAPNMYIVSNDTRDTYQEQKVEYIETSPAECGRNGVAGVKGTGKLKIFDPPQSISVSVFPDCGETSETLVKLPDGRVLYLRKAI